MQENETYDVELAFTAGHNEALCLEKENKLLRKQLKKQKRIHKHLWAAVKDLGDELDRKVQELEDLNFVADRRARQISCLRKDVVELQKKNDELVSVMTEMKPADETDLRVDWKANYYNEIKQSELLAEKVAQLEREATTVTPGPELDWQGNFNIERNRREVAEAMVRSLRSKAERLEQALKGSRQNPTLPADVIIFYPNGTKLTFLDRARNLFTRS